MNIFLKYVNINLLFALFLALLTFLNSSSCDFDEAVNNGGMAGADTPNEDDGADAEHTHDLILLAGMRATCTEQGLLECYKCSTCDMMYLDLNAENPTDEQPIIPTLAHILTFHEPTLADCTVGGYNAYYSCDVCGGLFLDADGESQIDNPPYVERLTHLLFTVPLEPPTCTSVGYGEHLKCTECGKIFSSDNAMKEITSPTVIDRIEHSLMKHHEILSTCQENGCDEYYSCINCGTCFEDAEAKRQLDSPPILEKLEHTLTEYPAKRPTCSESGYSNYFVCAVCDATFLDAEAKHRVEYPTVIDPIPHTSRLIQSQASTCTTQGTEAYYVCAECEKIFSDADCRIPLAKIPRLPLAEHDTEYCASIESTCTTPGTIEHYKCLICEQLFANSDCTVKIDGGIALPLASHIFENGKCINCHQEIELINYSEYLITEIGNTVSVCGFVTAINPDTKIIYVQYENYAYKLLNATRDGIEVGDMIIAVGLKEEDTSINCSYVSHYEPSVPVSAPTPYNATQLLISDIDGVLGLNQYVYVELDGITLLHYADNEYIMAYVNIGDISPDAEERFIYFTLDGSTPINRAESDRIKGNFAPMRLVTVRGLVYQDGARLSLIPVSDSFISNISEPIELPLEAMIRYESMLCPFDYDVISEDCVIELSCTPIRYEDVMISWWSTSQNVVIKTENGRCTAAVTVRGDELVYLIAEFSIINGVDEPVVRQVLYHINLLE